MFFLSIFLCTLVQYETAFSAPCNVSIISRDEWGARAPNDHDHMNTPVTVALIHHTDRDHCTSKAACIAELKDMQSFHMDNQSHSDIMYNFIIGEDGNVYEGRGWNTVGGHMPSWGIVSQGIAVMGNFQLVPPNAAAITALQNLLACLVHNNKLTPDYKIYAHRDVAHTNCPGNSFYEVIKTWSHYDSGKPVRPTKTPHHL
ncbi:peptidoglycan-recognition protein SC2-like [Saccostrea echinata]|uniref:peptidoglycan-recognition protein SC2-like n=1 Tax=Saccostrea echinata TaxID=191078 RepID=UPI002A827CE8|nr:peptidoglycan-recognition protein SC2-like [Saccostrea echinata]